MKFQFAFLALPLFAVANPVSSPDALAKPEAEANPIPEAVRGSVAAKAASTCALTGSDVKYRKCPSTDNKKCPAVGQYGAKGTKVSFTCWTTGSSVNGNTFWDKNSKGYYLSEYYVDQDCAFGLPQC